MRVLTYNLHTEPFFCTWKRKFCWLISCTDLSPCIMQPFQPQYRFRKKRKSWSTEIAWMRHKNHTAHEQISGIKAFKNVFCFKKHANKKRNCLKIHSFVQVNNFQKVFFFWHHFYYLKIIQIFLHSSTLMFKFCSHILIKV